ncbi:MAG: polyphosphate polymerase domain-containing protein, partial [Chloroflexota bacterium]
PRGEQRLMPEMLARYEFKYLIQPDRVAGIRDRTRMYCEPDAYGEQGVYEVNSLYLDDVDWSLARQTLDGVRQRQKLRMRTYGWTADDPVFCEIKGRLGTSILKTRALVDRPTAFEIARGDPMPGGIFALKESHQADLDRFRNRMDRLDLRGRMWVRYRREAWQSAYGDGARLTFDFDLQGQAADPLHPFEPDPGHWRDIWLGAPGAIILELKFNGAFPHWMLQLVHEQELHRESVSKYVNCVVACGQTPWATSERGDQWITF